MAVSVTREKHHRLLAQAAVGERARRFAIRRTHDFAAHDGQIRELSKAATADDCEHSVAPLNKVADFIMHRIRRRGPLPKRPSPPTFTLCGTLPRAGDCARSSAPLRKPGPGRP